MKKFILHTTRILRLIIVLSAFMVTNSYAFQPNVDSSDSTKSDIAEKTKEFIYEDSNPTSSSESSPAEIAIPSNKINADTQQEVLLSPLKFLINKLASSLFILWILSILPLLFIIYQLMNRIKSTKEEILNHQENILKRVSDVERLLKKEVEKSSASFEETISETKKIASSASGSNKRQLGKSNINTIGNIKVNKVEETTDYSFSQPQVEKASTSRNVEPESDSLDIGKTFESQVDIRSRKLTSFITEVKALEELLYSQSISSIGKTISSKISRIDKYIFKPFDLMLLSKEEQNNNHNIAMINEISMLQEQVRKKLKERFGFEKIKVQVGDSWQQRDTRFDTKPEYTHDRRLHNTVASIETDGYKLPNRVIRKPGVRIYVYKAESPTTNAVSEISNIAKRQSDQVLLSGSVICAESYRLKCIEISKPIVSGNQANYIFQFSKSFMPKEAFYCENNVYKPIRLEPKGSRTFTLKRSQLPLNGGVVKVCDDSGLYYMLCHEKEAVTFYGN